MDSQLQELQLDRHASAALYQQIAQAIRRAVQAGELAAGVKLPSTRDVALRLGVHRTTVVQAFHLLEEEGLVTSGIGQGTFVKESPAAKGFPAVKGSPSVKESSIGAPAVSAEDGVGYPTSFSWEGLIRPGSTDLSEIRRFWGQGQMAPDAIRFTGATADPSLFPAEDFRGIIDEVFRDHGSAALDYGPAEGHLPLREWVTARLMARGMNVQVDQVMIVTGSQQGCDLLSRLLLTEGDTALVEEPGYTSGFRLFQANGARALGVPMDDQGIRPDVLAQVCARTNPRLLYLMPHFQNPTGLSLDSERFDPILEICARERVPIIEDQFDADLFYEGKAPRPLKAHDRRDQVLLLGSFSKILFPGLRLGWVVVPVPLVRPLRELKQMADFSSSLLAQFAMDRYCRRGLLDRHLERVRRIYGARLRCMLEMMGKEFPADVQWTRPRGGLTLWVTLPAGIDALTLHERARRLGVDFSPGPLFFPNGGGSHHLRLSYIRETEERIQRGISLLSELIKSSLDRRNVVPAAGPFV